MDNLGYKKTLIGEFVSIGPEVNETIDGITVAKPRDLIPGKKYMVDFYLPGGVNDLQQEYFVADTQNVDDVLSQAYYEKHLYLISKQLPTTLEEEVIQKPKAFTSLTKTVQLEDLDKATIDLLKEQKMPEATELDGGLSK